MAKASLARRIVATVLGFALRIFFRRIRFLGVENVDPEAPTIFVLNHPNALLDPGLLLCHAPRRVSFLAKSTLFSMPLVGFLTRSFDSLPVYRAQDEGADPKKNEETFAAARDLLLRGGALALFPEGTSHSDAKMKPMKSGAARIALGAARAIEAARPGTKLRLVPGGLYYTDKKKFRSSVLIVFGPPIEVPVASGALGDEPTREESHALTERIREGIAALVIEADRREALDLVARAERIFTAAGESDPDDLERQRAVRMRLVDGYAKLRERSPETAHALEQRIARYEARRESLGLPVDAPSPRDFTVRNVTSFALRQGGALLALAPFALVGLVTHYPAYLLVDFIARRGAKQEEDVISTIKFLASLLFFPLTWGVLAGVVGHREGWEAGLAAFLLLPPCGLAAQLVAERLSVLFGGARALRVFATRRAALAWLDQERTGIRDEINDLARALEA